MQDIFIRVIFGILVLHILLRGYEITKKLSEEFHFILILIAMLIILTASYFAGGLLIK